MTNTNFRFFKVFAVSSGVSDTNLCKHANEIIRMSFDLSKTLNRRLRRSASTILSLNLPTIQCSCRIECLNNKKHIGSNEFRNV